MVHCSVRALNLTQMGNTTRFVHGVIGLTKIDFLQLLFQYLIRNQRSIAHMLMLKKRPIRRMIPIKTIEGLFPVTARIKESLSFG